MPTAPLHSAAVLSGSLYRSPPSPSTISADKLTRYEGAWVSPSGMHGAELHCFLSLVFKQLLPEGCFGMLGIKSGDWCMQGKCSTIELPLLSPWFYLRWGLAM